MKTYILTEKEIREIVSESYVCGIHHEHYRIDFSKLKESQPSISAEEFLKENGVTETHEGIAISGHEPIAISSGHIQKKTETRIFTNFDIPDVSLNNSIFSKTVIIDNGEGFVTIGWFDFIISEWSYESDFKLPEKFYWYYPTNIKNFKK